MFPPGCFIFLQFYTSFKKKALKLPGTLCDAVVTEEATILPFVSVYFTVT
jgi:hypothetical protein